MIKRWKITIEYDGTNYAGWQKQDNAPSVQQAIEKALHDFCQKEIIIYAAGRTDSGVHANGQIAYFDLDYVDGNGDERPLDGYKIAKAINAKLHPQPVTITKAEIVSSEFHARFDAVNKLYIYRIINRSAPPVLDKGKVWHFRRSLDVDLMRQAALYLLGHHDFTTYRDTNCQAKSPMRTLDRLDIEELDYDLYGSKELRFHIEGKSFLHHMVRNIVGTLTLVGEKKWQPLDVKAALEACDRTKGGQTAPACGLSLMRIDYQKI